MKKMRKKHIVGKRIAAGILSLVMAASMMPAQEIHAAEADVAVYAAAYQNAAALEDTSLPETVQVNGQERKVAWKIRSGQFAVPYQTVTVTGTADGVGEVHAQVETLPAKDQEVVYFIDATRDAGKESKAFESVRTLCADGLKNAVADQSYVPGDGWGRKSGSFNEKGTSGLDLTDKYQTGWYGTNSSVNSLQYQLMLEAGTYTATVGCYEWWQGPRTMKLTVSGTGVEGGSTEEYSVSSSSREACKSLSFTVAEDGPVMVAVENKSGSDAPVLSWLAVAKGTVQIPDIAAETEIVLKGADVEDAAGNINGLTYKGYGLLSGNSTSDLLMDYKEESPEAYEELLQVLFGGEHPTIQHIKMEMGNDGNNSTGADSCTMRFEEEEADVSRSPGFQLAADAKKINPDVKVSFLRWGMPSWVQRAWDSDRQGAGYEAMYRWYRETVFDAYEKYHYIVDYINPDTNETTDPDEDFIKWFRKKINSEKDFPSYMDRAAQEAYHKIKIIASDENTSLHIVPSMRKDQELYDAVDAIGFHYSTGTSSTTADYRRMADEDDKEVWYSEGCATFSYTEYQENKNAAYGGKTMGGYQSPLALADNFIASFIYSRKTHYIFQPAVGSFYEGAQYDHKEMISAREPWSGAIHYDPALYMLWHFTKFSKAGWENEDNTAGIWRVIPEASANTSGNRGDLGHLVNENGNPSYMTLAAPDKKNFSVVIVNNSAKTIPYRITAEQMEILQGQKLQVWETKTDSYMQYQGEAEYEDGSYLVKAEPFSMLTVTTLDGKEEAGVRLPGEAPGEALDTDASGKGHQTDDGILYADDFSYAGYAADYLEKRGNEPRYAVDFSGAFEVQDGKLRQVLTQSVSQWNDYEPSTVIGDYRWMNYKASVDVTVGAGSYAGLNIRQQTGMGFEGSGYSLQMAKDGSWKLKKRGTTLDSGKVQADADGCYKLSLEGKDAFISAWIDDVQVAVYHDENPEYFGRVRLGCGWAETAFDNLKVETVDGYEPYATEMVDNAADEVSYTGAWDIIAGAGGSNNDWYRSTSTTTQAGAMVHFTMNGGGFALIGENDGTARLTIEVDHVKLAENVAVQASPKHCAAYVQYGLQDGEHEVTVTVTEGKFVLDAIDFLPYNKEDKIVRTEAVYGAMYAGEQPSLPKTVMCTTASGETLEKEVIWNTEDLGGEPYDTILVSGKTKEGEAPVSARVEVAPKGLMYFVSGGTGTGYVDQKTVPAVSKPYESVKALIPTLKNNCSDAAYTEGQGWGYKDNQSMSSTIDEGDRPENYMSTDKYLVGLRDKTKGGEPMTYYFTLDAGSYVLTTGYHEFWGNRNRDMKPSVVWTNADGEEQTAEGTTIQLRGENQKSVLEFSLETDAVVEYRLSYVSGEAPMFSWIGVEQVEDKRKEEQKKAREDLEKALAALPPLDASAYTEASYQAYMDALEDAQTLLENEAASKEELQEAGNRLQAALENLEEIVIPAPDRTQLESALEECKDVDASKYTQESYQAYEEAWRHAQELLSKEGATQEEVHEAAEALRRAYEGLCENKIPAPDRTQLEKILEEYKDVDASKYTKESYEIYAKAMQDAQAVCKDVNATKEQLEAARIRLKEAREGLREKPIVQKVPLTAPAVTSVKSSAAKTGTVVTISLAEVAYADSYVVYRKVNGKETVVGETAGRKIQDTKPVSAKKAVYYAVAKAKSENYTDSPAGAGKEITLSKDVKKVTAKKAGKGIKVSFKKVKKAKGYVVYRSAKKNGAYKKLTKKPIRKLFYVDKKAKKGKTYYYKVVVYGSNKTYSAGKVSKKVKNK